MKNKKLNMIELGDVISCSGITILYWIISFASWLTYNGWCNCYGCTTTNILNHELKITMNYYERKIHTV